MGIDDNYPKLDASTDEWSAWVLRQDPRVLEAVKTSKHVSVNSAIQRAHQLELSRMGKVRALAILRRNRGERYNQIIARLDQIIARLEGGAK